MTDFESPDGFDEAPWGITLFWGIKRSGKTIASLNSPWRPVHIVDTEFSAESYEKHMDKLIEQKVLAGPFTRTGVANYNEAHTELERLIKEDKMYGTIIIDTFGQYNEWTKTAVFNSKPADFARKMSQVVWGEIRDNIRRQLILLKNKCNLLILTAHQREYDKVLSPRTNPATEELVDLSIRLERHPNAKLPNAVITGARLPFFPPQVEKFWIRKLLDYFETPADWDNLKPEEQVTETITTTTDDYEEGMDE